MSKNLRVEGTAEVNSTGNHLQLGQHNGTKLVVTADGETTFDLGQGRHADVGQVGVVVEGQISGGSQVGGREGGQVGLPEAELASELRERRKGDRLDVTDGDVLGSAEVGEHNIEVLAVTGEVDQVGGVGQVVDVDGLQVGVVLNVEGTDGLQGDTGKGAEASVDDSNVTNVSDTGVEGERLQTSESLPVDGADSSKHGEVHGGEDGRLEDVEVVADRLERGSNDTSQTGGIVGGDATSELLNTVQGEVTREVRIDLDGTGDSLAAGEGVGIALGHDSGVTTWRGSASAMISSRIVYSHWLAKAS